MRLPAVRLRIVTLHLPEHGGLNLIAILHAVFAVFAAIANKRSR
jgi:hypothetical protein